MQLHIDMASIEVVAEGNQKIEFDRFYPMPDGIHRFIVRRFSKYTLSIEIRRGKKQQVQSGTVRLLSSRAGWDAAGDPIEQPYVITLDPAKEIFPIAELVNRLLKDGIRRGQISPMFSPELLDCVLSKFGPQMASDGEVERSETSGSTELTRRTRFVVKNASWAIQYADVTLYHVYIWMNAADAESTETLLDAIRCIQAGELTPVYSA